MLRERAKSTKGVWTLDRDTLLDGASCKEGVGDARGDIVAGTVDVGNGEIEVDVITVTESDMLAVPDERRVDCEWETLIVPLRDMVDVGTKVTPDAVLKCD